MVVVESGIYVVDVFVGIGYGLFVGSLKVVDEDFGVGVIEDSSSLFII